MSDCPVCQGNLFAVDREVCDEHADTYIVTICVYCRKPVFSQESGVCSYHARMGQASKGSNKDHRASLRASGLEN